MAGKGPAPAASHTRARNDIHRDPVKADGKIGGFDLPDDYLPPKKDGTIQEWHAATVKWWDNWRSSPQGTRMMTAPDWDFLLDTALMHHQMWSSGRWDFAGEIRQRVAKFGATPEDRMRLKIEIQLTEEFPAGQQGTNVTSIKDRKSRIAG